MIKRYDLSKLLDVSSRKREGDESTLPLKRWKFNYNRECTYQCVHNDYMSPTPLFDDKQFERVFQNKRSMMNEMINNLASKDLFWTSCHDPTWKLSHSRIVKFLVAQKMLCYGVSINAFKDYFQMHELMGSLCLSKLCVGMVTSPWYSDLYLWALTKSDARQIVWLHKDTHSIDGMLESLDVTKINWGNCRAAWKGQFEGKEDIWAIGLDAVADYNLWFWHGALGFLVP
jgi:hypothetical protein